MLFFMYKDKYIKIYILFFFVSYFGGLFVYLVLVLLLKKCVDFSGIVFRGGIYFVFCGVGFYFVRLVLNCRGVKGFICWMRLESIVWG